MSEKYNFDANQDNNENTNSNQVNSDGFTNDNADTQSAGGVNSTTPNQDRVYQETNIPKTEGQAGGGESSYSYVVQPPPSLKEQKPNRPKGSALGLKVATIAVICSLAGGAVGGSLTYAIVNSNQTNDSQSNLPSSQIKIDDSYKSSVEAISDKVLPSTVGIRVSYLQQNFNNFNSDDSSAASEGSGIIYKSDGYIITNYHVISAAVSGNAKIDVYLQGNTSEGISATIVGYDAAADLAVIKIDKTGLTPIEIADSNSILVGQTAVAIGNPGGLEFMGSVSSGIISGLNRNLQLENGAEMELIQTDAAINPGNSGGALVDGTGKLIGVNSVKISASDYEGMGFAIPSNYVVEVCDRLIANQGKKQAYLGVSIDSRYTADSLKKMGYPAGVVVATVADGGPASTAGIQKNDIIVKVGDTSVTSYALLSSELNKYSSGDKVTITVYRGGKEIPVSVTLGETTR